MADAKRRDEWERTSSAMTWLTLNWSGKKLDPNALNPYVPRKPKTERQKELENQEGWLLLKAGLRDIAKGK